MRASGARRRVAKEAARMTARDDSSTAGSAFGEPGQASPANLAEHCSQDTSGDSCLTWRYSTKHYAAKYRPVECDYLAWALVQVPYYGPLSPFAYGFDSSLSMPVVTPGYYWSVAGDFSGDFRSECRTAAPLGTNCRGKQCTCHLLETSDGETHVAWAPRLLLEASSDSTMYLAIVAGIGIFVLAISCSVLFFAGAE